MIVLIVYLVNVIQMEYALKNNVMQDFGVQNAKKHVLIVKILNVNSKMEYVYSVLKVNIQKIVQWIVQIIKDIV